MNITLLLADAASITDGKLNLLGACWTALAGPTPHALVSLVELPWGEQGRTHALTLRLVDGDGAPVFSTDHDGTVVPVRIEASFEAPRSEVAGATLRVPFAISLVVLPLRPDTRYEWRAELDGVANESWVIGFATGPEHPDLSTPPW